MNYQNHSNFSSGRLGSNLGEDEVDDSICGRSFDPNISSFQQRQMLQDFDSSQASFLRNDVNMQPKGKM